MVEHIYTRSKKIKSTGYIIALIDNELLYYIEKFYPCGFVSSNDI